MAIAEADTSHLTRFQHFQALLCNAKAARAKQLAMLCITLLLMLTPLDDADSLGHSTRPQQQPRTDLLMVSVSMRTTSMSSCRQLSLRMPPMMATNLPMGTAACPDRARRLLNSCGPVGMGDEPQSKLVWRSGGTPPEITRVSFLGYDRLCKARLIGTYMCP